MRSIFFSFLVFSILIFPANTYAEKLSDLALKCINDNESCPKVDSYLLNNMNSYEDLRLKCMVGVHKDGQNSLELEDSCLNASIWEIRKLALIYEGEFEKKVQSAGIKHYSYTFATDNICVYGDNKVDKGIFIKSCSLSADRLIHRAFKRPKNSIENTIYFKSCTIGKERDSCYYVEDDDLDADSEDEIIVGVKLRVEALKELLDLSKKNGIKLPDDTKKTINEYIKNQESRKQELLKQFKEKKEAENTGDIHL